MQYRKFDRRLAVAARAALTLGAVIACGTADERAAARSDTANASATQPHTATIATDAQRVALTVRGMYCESCESTVAAMLRRAPGVLSADVSVERNEAIIMYDSARTSPAKLIDVVNSLGYVAFVKPT
jgi:copper chaperone CopZ